MLRGDLEPLIWQFILSSSPWNILKNEQEGGGAINRGNKYPIWKEDIDYRDCSAAIAGHNTLAFCRLGTSLSWMEDNATKRMCLKPCSRADVAS